MNSQYEYFSMEELQCSCCGVMLMSPAFMAKMVSIRRECGFSFPVTSAYRCPVHDASVSDGGSGAHTTGRAIDIAVSRGQALQLIKIALSKGITGIGVMQKGEKRFIHLDDLTNMDESIRTGERYFRPTIWSY